MQRECKEVNWDWRTEIVCSRGSVGGVDGGNEERCFMLVMLISSSLSAFLEEMLVLMSILTGLTILLLADKVDHSSLFEPMLSFLWLAGVFSLHSSAKS